MQPGLIHAIGCWVALPTSNGDLRKGVVTKVIEQDAGIRLQVFWIKEQQSSVVPASEVRSGFANGMDVQDQTPGPGVTSLGVGVVMQQRSLGGCEQALADFPEKGTRVWLPYQHLRQIKGPKHRFMLGDTGAPADAEKLRLRMLANAIETWNENTGALSHLDIDPLPHQINLVHHILASGNFNWLIADDVGLGKTIETGMLLHALMQRDLVRRVLLVTPAGLTKQWKEEMYHKFGMENFRIYGEDFQIDAPREWKMFDCVIGSIDRLKQEQHLASLMQAENWDLIIFDEGHRLSRRQYGLKLDASDRYKLAQHLREKTRHILLLSATPHQGMQDKFVALLELLRPDLKDELLTLSLNPEILRQLVFRNHKADVTDADGNFIFKGKLTRNIRVPSDPSAKAFDETLQKYLSRGYAAGAARGRTGNAIGFVMTVYRKLAASSAAAIHNALKNRLARLKNEWLNGQDYPEEPDDERYLGEWEEQLITDAEEFFSGEVRLLEDLIEKSKQLMEHDLKLQQFLDQIINRVLAERSNEKVLIFTEYRTTQNYLQAALQARYGEGMVELINGSMPHKLRSESIKRFENEAQFLISTEAGGEGINLQRQCHTMVNYDLPWNPMRLVQRVGRLYRYGQGKVVLVFNIHQPDTLDDQIIQLMYSRIDSVVSDMAQVQNHEFNEGLKEEILGEISDLLDVDDILRAATTQGIDRTEQRIEEALNRAREAAKHQRELFDHAATGTPGELRDELNISKDHLVSFVEGMLDQLGIEVVEQTHKGKILRINLPKTVMRDLKMSERASPRLDVTLDRFLGNQRPNTHMLDLNSYLLRYLLEKARDYDFGGISAIISSEKLGDGAIMAGMLRWQGLQGQRMRQEFAAITVNGSVAKLNSPAISNWLLARGAHGAVTIDRETSGDLFNLAEKTAQGRLADISSRYLIPENLQWICSGWTESQSEIPH
jgi:superfamily II DNA or RNA helicase